MYVLFINLLKPTLGRIMLVSNFIDMIRLSERYVGK